MEEKIILKHNSILMNREEQNGDQAQMQPPDLIWALKLILLKLPTSLDLLSIFLTFQNLQTASGSFLKTTVYI